MAALLECLAERRPIAQALLVVRRDGRRFAFLARAGFAPLRNLVARSVGNRREEWLVFLALVSGLRRPSRLRGLADLRRRDVDDDADGRRSDDVLHGRLVVGQEDLLRPKLSGGKTGEDEPEDQLECQAFHTTPPFCG